MKRDKKVEAEGKEEKEEPPEKEKHKKTLKRQSWTHAKIKISVY